MKKMSKDYYKILGIEKNASAEEIKKAYRKMSMTHHPDKTNGNKESEEIFKQVAESYDVLSDPDKKAKYDLYGSDGPQQNPFGNMNDMFGDDFLSQFFGGRSNRGGRASVKRGTDINVTLNLSMEEIFNGVHKKVKISRKTQCTSCRGLGGKDIENCRTCNGSGQHVQSQNTPFGTFQNISMCSICDGTGKSVKTKCTTCYGHGVSDTIEEIELDIPKGVLSGMTLQMGSKGNESKDGVSGNLMLHIQETNNTKFKRDGNNLSHEKKISIIDAILGTDIIIKSIDNKEYKITIDPGTQTGKVYRMPEKGMPILNSNSCGDLYIQIVIVTPNNISQVEKEIIEGLKSSNNFKVNDL